MLVVKEAKRSLSVSLFQNWGVSICVVSRLFSHRNTWHWREETNIGLEEALLIVQNLPLEFHNLDICKSHVYDSDWIVCICSSLATRNIIGIEVAMAIAARLPTLDQLSELDVSGMLIAWADVLRLLTEIGTFKENGVKIIAQHLPYSKLSVLHYSALPHSFSQRLEFTHKSGAIWA